MNQISKNLTARFYPKEVPIFNNETSTEKFEIVINDVFNKGVVSKKEFAKGDLLFKFAGEIQYHQTLYTLQLKTGVYIEDPYFMGRILHSCEPNSIVNMETQEFYAIQDINVGDYITIDYLKTEDVLFQSFQCACGSPDCKGYITGRTIPEIIL
ncbi:hypothetical protein U0X36_05410 [Bacillus thuringiensis]|uniref:SET domain-containing protein-lysine N-methyltransferase n=1 Tax=Bacillus thuringiensis TaxID=1428 RepID=UPI001EE8662D|nr:SET domain-containing protein-lysine N-methyltransferase [Bacillus thuringiensis]MDZ3952382.1 hypothetical protein [Bacillus thuringiensis]